MTQHPTSADLQTNSRVALLGWPLGLGVLTALVATGHVTSVDQGIARWVAAIRSPALDEPMRLLTFFGSSLWAACGLAGLSVLAWRRGDGRTIPLLVGAFLATFVLEIALRLSVPQWRPDVSAIPASMDALTRFQLAGFPSGHGIRSAFVFGWLARVLGGSPAVRLGRIACLVMIGVVGCTRLYLNRHWASDVVGGWLVVLVVLTLVCWVEGKWSRTSRRTSPAH